MSFVPKFGCNQPAAPRFGSVPKWDDANPVLPESEWREHNDPAQHVALIEAQQDNNCTNAALASLLTTSLRAAGVENVPRFSWSFQYARHNGGVDKGAFCRDLIWDCMMGEGRPSVGLPPVELWPDNKIFARGGFPQEVLAAAAKWGFLEVYQCMNFADVCSALSTGFGVYHGFVLGSSYQNTPGNGKVPAYDGGFHSGHAMYSCGLTKEFGDWRTITPNTWGMNFGHKGVAYWPEGYFWSQRIIRGQTYVNLDAYAVRAVKRPDPLPVAA